MPRRDPVPATLRVPPPAGCPTRLTVSAHAVQRYRERWRPSWPVVGAERELWKEVRDAVFVQRDGKAFIYRTPRGALLTVAADGTVMTVLPMGAVKTTYRPRKLRRKS